MPDADEDPALALLPALRDGDVVIVCSSGDFGGLHRRLVEALQKGNGA
jgi:UDP-N-acetylmuramate-alanine ligase